MSKFKVGDKVRFIGEKIPAQWSPEIGTEMVVHSLASFASSVYCMTNGAHFFEMELELVEEEAKMDLTKITMPFGLLDAETQKALREAANTQSVQSYAAGGWYDVKAPSFCSFITFRVKPPEPLVDMTIPWDAIKEELQWAAADADGRIDIYEQKPYTISGPNMWGVVGGAVSTISGYLTGVSRGNKPWDQTLQQRPKKEVK